MEHYLTICADSFKLAFLFLARIFSHGESLGNNRQKWSALPFATCNSQGSLVLSCIRYLNANSSQWGTVCCWTKGLDIRGTYMQRYWRGGRKVWIICSRFTMFSCINKHTAHRCKHRQRWKKILTCAFSANCSPIPSVCVWFRVFFPPSRIDARAASGDATLYSVICWEEK